MSSRSPLPGMDPWLEESWGDIHHSVIQYCRDQIADILPQGLFAKVEETVIITDRWGELGRRRPDIAAFKLPASKQADQEERGGAAVAIAEPVRIRMIEQPIVEGHIEIHSASAGAPLVTAIEVLSPTNKIDPRGRHAYEQKREAYYGANVNIVEIDLLRAGASLLDVSLSHLSPEKVTPYSACVRRAPSGKYGWEAEYYALPLRLRLPAIRIPLRPTDADVVLDLQPPIDEAYRKGRYADQLDYSKPPRPPLSPDDATWANELIRLAQRS